MKLIQRFGTAGLVLLLLLTMLPTAVFAAGSYQSIDGYSVASGISVKTSSDYPWTYEYHEEAETWALFSGNRNLGEKAETLSQIKVEVAKDGYLKFDYALPSDGARDIFSWCIGDEYLTRTDVSGAQIQLKGNGSIQFTSVDVDVKAGDVVYIVYSKTGRSNDADYGMIRNLRLVSGGVAVSVTSNDTDLGTVETNPADLSNLQVGDHITLTANEIDGQLEGWYENGVRISGDNPFDYTVTEDAAVEARFIPIATDAVAAIGNVGYDTLSAALTDAAKNATDVNQVTVKLMRDVEITEDLTIPKNVVLLVPFDSEDLGANPDLQTEDTVRQKGNVYRKLTVANGVNISVNGTLLVNAKLGSYDTNHQGSLGGDYGLMELNGSLTVNNGGALKVRGMLVGNGSITAVSGGAIYQAFEMTDWPGGSEAAERNGRGEFPISQYYMQRIQVPTTFEYGSSMSVFAYLFVPSFGDAFQLELEGLIGTADTSFFKMNEGSSMTLGYLPNTYTSTFDISGDVEVRAFNISMANYSISTANTVCPIPASFSLTLRNGTVFTIKEDMKLMPGAQIVIQEGAKVIVEEGNELYLYGTGDYNEPRVVPSSSDVTVPITPDGHAVILNYGTLKVDGKLHTSASAASVEAQVVTLGNGKVEGSENISQGTVGQTEISYNGNGGSGKIASHYAKPGESVNLTANTFARDGFTFKGWSADPDFAKDPFLGTETLITYTNINSFPEIGIAKLTLYAVWEEIPIAASDYAVWKVGGNLYGYATDAASYMTQFNSAMSAAQSSGKTVILANDGTMPAGDYVIPKGVNVLIPYSSGEAFDVNPVGVYTPTTYQMPTDPYRVLTMAPGAKLTVNGALNVGSRMYSGEGGSVYAGAPTGNSARIKMQENSSIVVNGTLYAYGFIYGFGSVSAESGSHIHEMFQLTEQRGGSNLMNLTSGKFPVTQYYVQNIEVPLTYKCGTTETMHTNMYVLDQQNPINDIAFLGSSSGLFQMSSGAEVVRTYDPTTDRLIWDVYGDITFASTVLDVQGMATLDTTSYTLPLTNNFTINIHSGKTTLLHKMELLPGVQVTIDKGATLFIDGKSKLWVYDRDSWVGKGFVFDKRDISPVAYSPTKAYNRTVADLVDASINVNGEIYAEGKIYSTMSDADRVVSEAAREKTELYTPTSGANIYTSEGTGEVYLYTKITALDSYTAKIVNGDGTWPIAAISVLLHNANASGTVTPPEALEYTHTQNYPAKTRFKWCAEHGRWENGEVTVKFMSNGGRGDKSVTVHRPGVIPAVADQFSKGTLHFKGWNTKADGSGTDYEDGFVANSPDTTLTLYAQWEGTVTWVYGENNESMTKTLDEGEQPTFTGATPTKAETDQNRYTFAGWSTEPEGEPLSEIPPMTGDVTYYAVFDAEVKSYTIIWKNKGGTVLDQQKVPYGEMPVYNGKNTDELTTVNEESDDVHVYSIFQRWIPEMTTVTGDKTYEAKYTAERYYAIRFYTSDNVRIDTYMVKDGTLFTAPAAPEAPAGFEFAGWATTPNGEPGMNLPAATAPTNYYAVYTRIAGSAANGDINGDGYVDIVDLNMLLANFNAHGDNEVGDINGDTYVDIVDLNTLLANFNSSNS